MEVKRLGILRKFADDTKLGAQSQHGQEEE
jgi:hypothetical protein